MFALRKCLPARGKGKERAGPAGTSNDDREPTPCGASDGSPSDGHGPREEGSWHFGGWGGKAKGTAAAAAAAGVRWADQTESADPAQGGEGAALPLPLFRVHCTYSSEEYDRTNVDVTPDGIEIAFLAWSLLESEAEQLRMNEDRWAYLEAHDETGECCAGRHPERIAHAEARAEQMARDAHVSLGERQAQARPSISGKDKAKGRRNKNPRGNPAHRERSPQPRVFQTLKEKVGAADAADTSPPAAGTGVTALDGGEAERRAADSGVAFPGLFDSLADELAEGANASPEQGQANYLPARADSSLDAAYHQQHAEFHVALETARAARGAEQRVAGGDGQQCSGPGSRSSDAAVASVVDQLFSRELSAGSADGFACRQVSAVSRMSVADLLSRPHGSTVSRMTTLEFPDDYARGDECNRNTLRAADYAHKHTPEADHELGVVAPDCDVCAAPGRQSSVA